MLAGNCADFVLAVSIHAPARGATDDVYQAQVRYKVSIHAPARGATASWRQPGT